MKGDLEAKLFLIRVPMVKFVFESKEEKNLIFCKKKKSCVAKTGLTNVPELFQKLTIYQIKPLPQG